MSTQTTAAADTQSTPNPLTFLLALAWVLNAVTMIMLVTVGREPSATFVVWFGFIGIASVLYAQNAWGIRR